MMATDQVLRKQQLFINPTARLAVCLVLDCSPSMSGRREWGAAVQQLDPSPIEELNEGVREFFDAIQHDEIAAYSAEVAIVRFDAKAETVLDFSSTIDVEAPTLELMEQGTSIGNAVNLALDLLEQRKAEYKEAGIDYYQPWLVLMTDGQPNDDAHVAAAHRTSQLLEARRLTTFCVGIGDGADFPTLRTFATVERPPLRLRQFAFRDFFEWLSQSIHQVSQTTPGEAPQMPPTRSWADPAGPDEPW